MAISHPPYNTGETVGIKVNCQIPLISTQWKVAGAVIRGLVGMGIPQKNIVIWDADSEGMKYSDDGLGPGCLSRNTPNNHG